MNWLYPEEGHEWKEGDEIVAEFEYIGSCVYTHRLKRVDNYWLMRKPGENRVFFDSHIRIIAYIPYVKPEPPEKPQDCPFCGRRLRLLSGSEGGRFRYECKIFCMRFPEGKTKAEAIKALNSVRVAK